METNNSYVKWNSQKHGSTTELSVPQLITQLCTKLSEELGETSSQKKRKTIENMRSIAFETLLKKSCTDIRSDKQEECRDNLIGKLVDRVYFSELQHSKWSQKKNQELQNVVDKLTKLMDQQPQLESVLQFLLHMSHSCPPSSSRKKCVYGLEDHHLNLESHRQSLFQNTKNRSYPEFSSSLFDIKMTPSDVRSNTSFKERPFIDAPFDSYPGSGLKICERYSSVWSMQNRNFRSSEQSINRFDSLSIPELNLDVPRSLTIPSFRSSHLDEGYVTPDKEFNDDGESVSVLPKKKSDMNVWDKLTVENLTQPLRYTWENLGKPESVKEPAFLLQSNTSVVECWKMRRLKEVLSVESSLVPQLERNITLEELFREIKYLLIGISSKIFVFNEAKRSFVIEPGICVAGLTSEALKVFVEDFISCGNDFRILNTMVSRPKDYKMFSQPGLVFEALCSSLSTWLQAYRGMVVKMVEGPGLLKLKAWLQPLQMQLHFLVQLCCPSPHFLSSYDNMLPHGGELLSYIYSAVQSTVYSELPSVLYHILENCSKVYFRFIEKWLFEGVCDDPYGEFFIEVRNNYETTLDRSYWRKAFRLKVERIPTFMMDVVEDIFICGKSLNLVKLCTPNDPLCTHLESHRPRMSPCLEEISLIQLTSDYHEFVTACASDCSMNPLQQSSSPTPEEKVAYLESVKKQRDKSISRIKDALEEQRKIKFEEKRKIFDMVKKEMEDAEERKLQERRRQLAEEKEILEGMAQSALLDAARKDAEKRKIIEFYKALSDQAELRRLRADWKMKRLHLNDRRIDFLYEEKKSLKDEILKHKLSEQMKTRRDSLKADDVIIDPTINESACSWITCDESQQVTPIESKNTMNDGAANIDSNRLEEESVMSLRIMASNEKYSDSDWTTTEAEEKSSEGSASMDDIDKPIVLDTDKPKTSSKKSISILEKYDETNIIGDNGIPLISVCDVTNTPALAGDSNKINDELNKTNLEPEHDSSMLNKLYNTAKNEALLNKKKVLEDEFNLSPRLSGDNRYDNIEDSSKDKVIEMKIKMNEDVIKERTHELEMACLRAVESRKEAARNKKKVMSGEYNLFQMEVFGRRKEELKENDSTIPVTKSISSQLDDDDDGDDDEEEEKSFDKSNRAKMSAVKSDSSPTKKTISLNMSPVTSEKIFFKDVDSVVSSPISDKISCISLEKDPERQLKVMSSSYFNKDGRFIFDQKPLIIDITDNYFKQKSRSNIDFQNVDMTAIHTSLFKSISIPTEILKIFTNDAILRLFLVNEKLMEHLQCIRKYFLLLDGEYGRILTRNLFSELETAEHPSVLLTHLRLNAILRSASSTFYMDSTMTERLSFFVKETPLTFLLTEPEVLSCLSMRYRLHWPLNVVLSEDAILGYDKIFAFQLQLQRTSWVLEQEIQLLKIKGMMRSTHFRQLQIFRHTMTQFIRALTNYVTTIAFEDSWLQFKQSLVKVDTLDALHQAHVKYVKLINFRCLLNKRSEQLHITILKLLRTILTFHELLRNGEWVYDQTEGNHTHSAFPRLLHQFGSFRSITKYLVQYLKQLMYKGYQPHLDLLLTYVSGNDYYLH